jgi:hypothetical protein
MDIDNWTYKARNAVLFNNINEAPLTMEEYIQRAKQNEKIINKDATRFKNEAPKRPDQVNNISVLLIDSLIMLSIFRLSWHALHLIKRQITQAL